MQCAQSPVTLVRRRSPRRCSGRTGELVLTFRHIIRVVTLPWPEATLTIKTQVDEVADRTGIVPVTEDAIRLYETRLGAAARAAS